MPSLASVRFAPSPTGRFHIGNLRTAWISRQWALSLNMPWVVRFEDIDKPRVVKGARESQLRDMAALGLIPERIALQSEKAARHYAVFVRWRAAGLAYPCYCSRKELQGSVEVSASAPHGRPAVYSGRCRNLASRPEAFHATIAWRLRLPLENGADDFIVARTPGQSGADGAEDLPDFVPSYNFACAVDDYDGDHALLVRAWDLDHVTGQQRVVQEKLAQLENNKSWTPPAVFHCSLITRDDGGRLEKRTQGVTLDELLSAGMDSTEILSRFKAGFHLDPRDFQRGRVWGEALREILLGRLLR